MSFFKKKNMSDWSGSTSSLLNENSAVVNGYILRAHGVQRIVDEFESGLTGGATL